MGVPTSEVGYTSAPLYNIFPNYLINSAILGGKKGVMEPKCVFWQTWGS